MSLEVRKILTRQQVAEAFKKSTRWVERQTALGGLIPHYAGETPLYYEDEVVECWIDGKLDARAHDSDNKNKDQRNKIRGKGQVWGPSVIGS
jgi:hypothetical protein